MAKRGEAFAMRVRLEHTAGSDYPYRCAGWQNVGGFNVGDRYTEEVGEVLIESMRSDGIDVVVEEIAHATGPA
jgi:hypothetical protein